MSPISPVPLRHQFSAVFVGQFAQEAERPGHTPPRRCRHRGKQLRMMNISALDRQTVIGRLLDFLMGLESPTVRGF